MLDKNNWNIVRAVIGMRKKEELAFVCDNQKWYNKLPFIIIINLLYVNIITIYYNKLIIIN